MGKRGPCLHCGIERTPLWRNGPAEKPVLCNACGSRYRLRGTLDNYIPKHLQAFSLKKEKERKQGKTILHPSSKEENFKNNSEYQENVSSNTTFESYESSNRLSTSECTMISSNDGERYLQEDVSQPITSGKIQPSLWNMNVPSRKRSMVVYISLSPIERLQRDLNKIQCTIRTKKDSSSSQDHQDDGVLLYNNKLNNHISPSEIGLGTMLLKLSRNQ